MAELGLHPVSEAASARFSESIQLHILQLPCFCCPSWKVKLARGIYPDVTELIAFEVKEYWEI